jgi:polynucleotide 5'-kinase involved in rRNA processing
MIQPTRAIRLVDAQGRLTDEGMKLLRELVDAARRSAVVQADHETRLQALE